MSTSPELPSGAPVCFPIGGRRGEAAAAVRNKLASGHAEALSELMPVFICGEESAALTFRRFADTIPPVPLLEDMFQRIADDEERHERLLQSIRFALPVSAPVRQVPELRRFFKAAADRQAGSHLVRIAALDSAVCAVLAELRSRRCPVARDKAIEPIFARIHRDEAQHVRLSMLYVGGMSASERWAVASDMRRKFARLVEPYTDTLDRLAVDPDQLLARLRTVPRFLVR